MTEPTRLFNLDDEDLPATFDNAKMLIYGHPGSGKTVLWGSGSSDVLFMDSDGGTRSALATGSKATVVPVLDYQDLHEVYDWLKHEALPEKRFRWVVWDSISLFQDRALIDDIVKEAAAANPKQSSDVASMREYLINQNRISEFIRLFSDLPCNFGVSALVLPAENPEGEIIYMPDVRGKGMASKICGYMNIVGYLACNNKGKRRLITGEREHYYAKDRFNVLKTNGETYIDSPTLPKLERLLFGKATGANPSKARKPRPRTRKAASK